jgi:single-strand DNA-binding protein
MASINKATIIGFVGQEPKVDTLQSGVKVASFSVATTEKGYTTQSGATIPDRTEWHNIVLWGKLAEVAGNYLHKGSSVYVEGKIRTRSYDDRNGVKRYVTEIHGDIMQMLDRKSDGGNQQQYAGQGTNGSGGSASSDDDDLPF